MTKIAKISTLLCAVILSLCVFPLCLIRKEVEVHSALDVIFEITETRGQELTQSFVAQSGYLSELDFYIRFPDTKPEEGELTFSIHREDGKAIAEKTIPLCDVNDGAFTCVSVNKWIKKGEVYSYTVTASKAEFQADYTMREEDFAPGSVALFWNGEAVGGQAVAQYRYKVPLNWKNTICLWAFIWMICLTIYEMIDRKPFLEAGVLIKKAEGLLERWQIPVLIAELAVVILLVVRICRNEAVDWDEAYTWQLVTKNSLPEMLKATAADVHPPLYYMLVMAAMKIFGESIFVAKMVSVSAAAATGILGITLVRKRWGVRAAIPFLLVAGLGPQMIYYNVNVRMYSWVSFFVIAAVLSAYEIMRTNKAVWWVCFTVTALGGVYTQYFAVVPLTVTYLYLGAWIIINDRKQIGKWLGCCIATVIGYLPWLMVVIDTLRRDSSDAASADLNMGIGDLCKWAFENNIIFSVYMPVVLLIVAVIGLLVEYRKYEPKKRSFIVFLGLAFLFTYGLCVFLSSQMNHFWHYRYLLDALLCIWLFMFIILARKNLIAWGCMMVWLSVLVLSSYAIVQATELNTVPWIQQARQLLAQVQNEEKIVYTFPTFEVLYEYYVPNAEFVWYEDVDFNEMDEFYVISWGQNDFSWQLYADGILKKEELGSMRLEEGVTGELWKISYQK